MKLIISGNGLAAPVTIEQEEGQDFNLTDGPVIDREQAADLIASWRETDIPRRAVIEGSYGDFILAGPATAFDKDEQDTNIILHEWASEDGFWLTDWPFAGLALDVQVVE